jgi:hypothetical protein
MTAPRYFLMGGGSSPEELLDRAAARGEVVRAAAHRTPAGSGVYGAVEIQPKTANAGMGAGGDEGAGATTTVGQALAAATTRAAPAPGEPGGAP